MKLHTSSNVLTFDIILQPTHLWFLISIRLGPLDNGIFNENLISLLELDFYLEVLIFEQNNK